MLLVNTAVAVDSDKVFQQDVAPILQKHCFACHNSEDRKGDFAIQTKAEVLESGYIESGDPNASHFLAVLKPDGNDPPAMPKDREPLKQEEIEVLAAWIRSGAFWPEDYVIEEPAIKSTDWWSWNPLAQQPVPAMENPFANRFEIENPIDAFILAKLLEKGLEPSAAADRRTLVRRVY